MASYTVLCLGATPCRLRELRGCKANIPNSAITQEGTSYQANLRYGLALPSVRAFRHELTLGLDYRHLDSNLEFVNLGFGPTDDFRDSTVIAQGVLGYSGLLPDDWGSSFVGAEFYYSPGNLTDLNNDTAFGQSYPLAEADYHYARFSLERVTRLLAGFSCSGRQLRAATSCQRTAAWAGHTVGV